MPEFKVMLFGLLEVKHKLKVTTLASPTLENDPKQCTKTEGSLHPVLQL